MCQSGLLTFKAVKRAKCCRLPCTYSRLGTLISKAEAPQHELVPSFSKLSGRGICGIRSQLCSLCLIPAGTTRNMQFLQPRPVPADEHDGYSASKYYSTFQEPGKKQHATHGSAGDLAALDQVEDPQRMASAYSIFADCTVADPRASSGWFCAEHASQQASVFFCKAW